jgi:hypothetical protein
MSHLTNDESLAIVTGWQESERVQRAYGRASYSNPHPWASPLHRAFEFGYYLQEKGFPLPIVYEFEKGRGGRFRRQAESFKVWYSKTGMGIIRECI